MRLAVLKSFPWRIVYLVAAFLLLLALAVFGSSGNIKQTQNNKEPISSKFQEENQSEQTDSSQEEIANKDESVNNSQTSSSTKVSVSVESNTTNGETTGQASATVTQNGETQTITKDFEDTIEGVNFKVDVSNGEFEFSSRVRERSKSKTSTDQDVKITQESD